MAKRIADFMTWVRLDKEGQVTGTFADEPGKGVWIAKITLPHTDEQCTAEYFAVNGEIFAPSICWNGEDRNKALKRAQRELTYLAAYKQSGQ